MDKISKRTALILTHVGGLIIIGVLLAGLMPYIYRTGIVYPGFGWYKAGITVIGLVLLGFGLFKLCKKPAK
jgi:hypothetical protein